MSRDLRVERHNKGLSARAAALQIGIARDTYERAESGDRPTPAVGKKIADFFGGVYTDFWPLPEDIAA